MARSKNTGHGFAIVETILVIVILFVIGFISWYVWHTKQATDKTLNNASQSSHGLVPPVSSNSSKTYSYTISLVQWGVQASYTGPLSLSFVMSQPDVAKFSAQQLTSLDHSCDGYGGHIQRFAPTDPVSASHDYEQSNLPAAKDYFAKQPTGSYAYVNGYYYLYVGDEGLCSGKASAQAMQEKVSAAIKALVPRLQAAQ
jgi:hypothetical protein